MCRISGAFCVIRITSLETCQRDVQRPNESADAYITDIVSLAKKVPVTDETIIRFALIKGFRPTIKQFVLQSQAQTLEDTKRSARIAEAAASQGVQESSDISVLSKDIKDLMTVVRELQSNRASTPERVAAVRPSFPPPVRSAGRHVSWQQDMPPSRRMTSPRFPVQNTPLNWNWPQTAASTTQSSGIQRRPSSGMYRPRCQQPSTNMTTPNYNSPSWNGQFSGKPNFSMCFNCGRRHRPGLNFCYANGLQCYNCARMNHVARMCRSAQSVNRQFSPQ